MGKVGFGGGGGGLDTEEEGAHPGDLGTVTFPASICPTAHNGLPHRPLQEFNHLKMEGMLKAWHGKPGGASPGKG